VRAPRVHFVFVSEWLRRVTEADTLSRGRIRHYSVIPNVIDGERFPYREKRAEDRLRIFNLRSYGSRKYATDITARTIGLLAEKPFFNELSFTVCGDGRLWDKTAAPLKKYDNVTLLRRFFSHDEIAALHAQHGVALMPSRQDTHGVSTCEAMSSGLAPISSGVSAIPEYVPADCGLLARSAQGFADAVEQLYRSPERFLELSARSAAFVREKCAADVVIGREIALITGQEGQL